MKNRRTFTIGLLAILILALGVSSMQAQTSLFFEGFEGTFPPAGWSVVDNATGTTTDVWQRSDYYTHNNISSGNGFAAECNDDDAPSGSNFFTDLITPSINLATWQGANISFWQNHQDFAGYGEAWIYISTDGGTTWTQIWNETNDYPSGSSWTGSTGANGTLETIDISAYIPGNIMLKFTYTDDNYSGGWGWQIDEVQVEGTQMSVADNAGIAAITSPTSPVPLTSVPVIVEVGNFGTNNITSALVRWSVDGVLQTQKPFVGNLTPGSTATLNLGNVTLAQGTHTITAWTNFPNGVPDQDPSNDTTSVELIACDPLNGIYAVGPGADYDSLQAALDDLLTCGVSGPVTFNVANGTYNKQYTLTEVPGASATNTITIQSATGNATDVEFVYAPTSNSDNFTFLFDGADHFILRDLTISTDSNGTSDYRTVIALDNGADYNTVDNCTLNGGYITDDNDDDWSVVYCDGSAAANHNTFTGNTLVNGTYGFHFEGSSGSNMLDGNMLMDNTIIGFTYRGVFIDYNKNSVVSGNEITSSTDPDGSVYGMYYSYTDSTNTINANKVYMTGASSVYGIYFYYCDGVAGNEISAYNNSITIDGGTSSLYGIRQYNGEYQNIYNNSVLINSGDGSSEYAYYIYGTDDVNIMNNCFANMTGGYAAYATSSPVILTLDNNNYYTTGATLGYYNGTTFSNLADWQAATLVDLNSVSVDPFYTSTTDLTPQSEPMDDKGAPVAMVPNDITGAARNATTPDIGAYEFTGTSSLVSISAGSICDGTQLVMPVNVANFNNVGAISMALDVDSGFTFNSVQNVHTSLTNSSFFLNATSDQVKISWLDTTATGTSFPDGAILELVFDANIAGEYSFDWDLGPNGCEIADIMGNPLRVDYVGDGAMISACSDITGNLLYYNEPAIPSIPNTPMNGVEVALNDDSKAVVATAMTDAAGDFNFADIPNGTYVLNFNHTKDWGGVNSVDALQALQHTVGLINLAGMRYQVGDVNNSGNINATDALRISQRFVGQAASFALPDWQYDADSIELRGDTLLDVFAGCAGDINGSHVPPSKYQALVHLGMKGQLYVREGQEVDIPFYATQDMEVGAAALELRIPAGIEVIDLSMNTHNGELLWNEQDGALMISWYGLSPMRLAEGELMFEITAEIMNKHCHNFAFGGQSQLANASAEVYTSAGIHMPKLSTASMSAELHVSNFPNPFNAYTTITYSVPEDGQLSLKLFDITGAEIATLVEGLVEAGEHTYVLDRAKLAGGMYIYTLSQGGKSVSGRMLITK